MATLVLLVAILFLTIAIFAKRRDWLRTWRLIRVIPEPHAGHWLTGHSADFSDRLKVGEVRLKWKKLLPRIYRYGIGPGMSLVNLPHPDTASVIFRSVNCPKIKFFYGFLIPWLGEGLLVSNGCKWARDRRLLTNCFHFDILRSYVDVYTDAINIMLENWSHVCASGKSVDVTKSCTMLTLDIILRCAMGFESNCQLDTGNLTSQAAQYADAVVKIAHLISTRQRDVLHFSDFIYFNFTRNGKDMLQLTQKTHDMSYHLIQERRRALYEHTDHEDKSQHHRDFLDVLLTVKDEDGKGLDDEEIREQVDTFLFRGHDTTASALQWTLYYLSKHRDLQEKCRSEVLNVLSRDTNGSDAGKLSHESLGELPYLTQFIKESLRIASPVPFIGREAGEEMSVDGYTLPVGCMVELSLYDLHMTDEYWPEPEKFNPDRFTQECSKGRHPYSFVPFSAGPRNCIGQAMAMDELKTSTALILSRFRLLPDSSQPEPRWQPAMVARPNPNIKLRLEET